MGRRKLAEGLKQVMCRCQPAIYERLCAEAERRRRVTGEIVRVSDVIRTFLLEGLERSESSPRPSPTRKARDPEPEPARKLAATGT